MAEKDPRRVLAGLRRVEKHGACTEAATAAGVAGMAYWRAKVDPDGTLDPDDREVRAKAARRAFYIENQLKSVAARKAKASKRGAAA